MQRWRTELANRHHAKASRQASVPCQKNKAIRTPSRLSRTTKTTKETTRVREISHLWVGNHSKSMEKEKKNNVDQQACPWSQHHRNCTGEHPLPVSSLLKGLIRRKNSEKTKLSNAATKNRTWCLCMMSVCKFCSSSLHCLIWFSRCSSAWWVPWARTKPVADTHQCNSCDVVIMDMPVDLLIRCGSPPRGAISLVPLWFPWWFL